jgi:hypothetical protein
MWYVRIHVPFMEGDEMVTNELLIQLAGGNESYLNKLRFLCRDSAGQALVLDFHTQSKSCAEILAHCIKNRIPLG